MIAGKVYNFVPIMVLVCNNREQKKPESTLIFCNELQIKDLELHLITLRSAEVHLQFGQIF